MCYKYHPRSNLDPMPRARLRRAKQWILKACQCALVAKSRLEGTRYSSSRVIFVSTTPPTGRRLACFSPAHLTILSILCVLRLRQSGFYILQASLSLRLMHVYFLPRLRNHRVRVRVNIASDIASEPRADLFGRGTTWIRVIRSSRAGKDASSVDIAMKWC
jgi:hypothetical protein